MQSLSMRSAKNVMSSGRALEHRAEDGLQERLGEVRVVGQIGEGDLRLDHPELGEVAARVEFSARKVGPNV